MKLDRHQRPEAAPVEPFAFPAFESHTLDNGLKIVAATDRRFPLVQLGLVVKGGADSDSRGLRGVTSLGAALLDEGTGNLDSQTIAAFVEQRGAELVSTGDWDGIYVGASCLTAHTRDVLDLAARVLRTPSLAPEELERLRAMRLADLANRATRPSFVAARQAVSLAYGDEHPYGETYLGTTDTVAAITRDDVVAWHAARVDPERAALVAAGDIDIEQLRSLAEHSLGGWESVGGPAPASPQRPEARSLPWRIVNRPDAAQTELRLVRPGASRTDPDHLDARVLSLLLGDKFTSRLNLNLREHLGITYGVSSRLSWRRGVGPFTIGCAVETAATGTALTEILGEMKRLVAEPPSGAEVEDSKNYLLGTFPYQLQTFDGVVQHLEELLLYGLPRDTFHRLPEEVRRVTAESVHRAAQSLLRTDDLVVVAVGPASELEGQLGAHGEVETVPMTPHEEPAAT